MSSFMAATLLLGFSVVAGNATAQRPQVLWLGETLDGRSCTGAARAPYGPFNYLTATQVELWRVENRHFTSQVEQLIRGDTTSHPMGDVVYTLNVFPNHHRALHTAIRFSLGESRHGSLERYPAECYLQRAINFSPNDSVPHMLYGLYLHRLGQLEQSLEKYQAAEAIAPNDASLLYNMGLLHFDRANYQQSHEYAVKAYNYGIEFPALRRRLQEAGHWE